MKRIFSYLGAILLSLSTYAAMNVNKIDPPFWYTGMQNPELQLMVYGEGIGKASVSVNYPGVTLSSTVKLESDNYLLVYLPYCFFNLISPLMSILIAAIGYKIFQQKQTFAEEEKEKR